MSGEELVATAAWIVPISVALIDWLVRWLT